MLKNLYEHEIHFSSLSPQELWDIIKARIKKFVKGYGRQRVDWRKQQLIALQRKRQRLLRQAIPTSILSIHLPRVERQIQTLQEETVKIAILKAEQICVSSTSPTISPNAAKSRHGRHLL
ncbi:hypothetical protein G6F44_013645 [Rhizopus delemar]|nr:hypothetical protein G6F44_013645 [Rhizopus delemar]